MSTERAGPVVVFDGVCVLCNGWVRFLLRCVPRRLRDAGYRMLARNRYRWFGRRAECLLPPPSARGRFIGQD